MYPYDWFCGPRSHYTQNKIPQIIWTQTIYLIHDIIYTCIADGFHFINIVVVDDLVKCGVEFVEEVHHLIRSA